MGGNVSCFSPADEDFEFSKTHFHPNPRSASANITGRNTNSNPCSEEPASRMLVAAGAEEPPSCAHGDTMISKASLESVPLKSSNGSREFQQVLPTFRADQLGYAMNPNNSAYTRYSMFVRNVNNSFADVDRILTQRLLLGLQRRYGCRMQQHPGVALFRGNEVRLATIDGPSRSHICKFRSALPTSLTKFLIMGVNHSADVDDVLDTN